MVSAYSLGLLLAIPLLRLTLRLVCWTLCMMFHILTLGLFCR